MNSMKANDGQGYGTDGYLPSYPGEVQKPNRADQQNEAIAALLELVDATEEDNLFTGAGVTPAHYEQLAIIFRERKEYAKEIAILARYARQKYRNGDSRREALKMRLETAMKLFLENKSTI